MNIAKSVHGVFRLKNIDGAKEGIQRLSHDDPDNWGLS
jgi:hypothetical protein